MPDVTISYLDPVTGAETVLNDGIDFEVLVGLVGDWIPSFLYQDDPLPGEPGSVLKDYDIDQRFIDLPLLVYAPGGDVRAKLRMLHQVVRPQRNASGEPLRGRLRFAVSGLHTRDLHVIYSGGLSGNDGLGAMGDDWYRAVLSFKANDPYWYADGATSFEFALGEAGLFFPFFPLVFSATQVLADTTINNPGDGEAWPVWTLTGPGDNIALRNKTTGKNFLMDALFTLATGEQLVIDTRPGRKTIVDQNGVSLFASRKKTTAEMWPLITGNNRITVEMNNSDANSSVALSFTPRYETW